MRAPAFQWAIDQEIQLPREGSTEDAVLLVDAAVQEEVDGVAGVAGVEER